MVGEGNSKLEETLAFMGPEDIKTVPRKTVPTYDHCVQSSGTLLQFSSTSKRGFPLVEGISTEQV